MNGRDIFVRPINPNDVQRVAMARFFFEKIAAKSHFDRTILNYPNVVLLEAYRKLSNQTLLVVPIHPVYMMESLGPNPEATPLEISMSLAQVVKTLHYASMVEGKGEIYFPCTDEDVNKMAEGHGFVRMTADNQSIPFLKMKVG